MDLQEKRRPTPRSSDLGDTHFPSAGVHVAFGLDLGPYIGPLLLLLSVLLFARCLRWSGITLVCIVHAAVGYACSALPAAVTVLAFPGACGGLAQHALPALFSGALSAAVACWGVLGAGKHLGRALRCHCGVRALVVALALVLPCFSGGFLAAPPRGALHVRWALENAWGALISRVPGAGGEEVPGGWMTALFARLITVVMALRGDTRRGGTWEEANEGCVAFFEGGVRALRVALLILLIDGVRRGVREGSGKRKRD